MSSRRLGTIALVWLVSAYDATSARASDLTALLAEPVQTTAGKSAGTAASAPALSINVTAEDLRRYGIRNLAEAYNFLTLGLVAGDPLGEPEVGGRGLMFAGDQNKHILLLIDGHSTNDQESGASQHGSSLGLPMELIDHIEVVLGPGSVLYGSNAMLGVVNVVTKRAKDYAGVHLVLTSAYSPPLDRAHGIVTPALTTAYLGDVGQAYRLSLGAGKEFQLRGLPAELTAQIEFETSSGPTMVWGPQIFPQQNFGPRIPRGSWGGTTRNSLYEHVPSGYARFVWGEFEAAAHAASSQVSMPYVRVASQIADFDDPDGAKVRHNLGLDLKWRHSLSLVTSVLARVYGDSTSEFTPIHTHTFLGCIDNRPDVACLVSEDGYSRWVGTELQGSFDWTQSGSMATLIGADVRVRRNGYQTGNTEVDTGRRVVYAQVDDTNVLGALYAQHVYRPVKGLTVNGGVRWDIDAEFGSRLLPRAAVIVEPWPGGTLKSIYSQAFRAPTTDELKKHNPFKALQSQGLTPESVQSIEAILEQRFGTQNLVFGVFRSWWTDMIVSRELDDITRQIPDADSLLIEAAKRDGLLSTSVQVAYQYRNVASIDNYGFNGGYDGTLAHGRLVYALNLTASYARQNLPEGTRRVTLTPSMFGNARVSYDLANALPVLSLAAHFSDRRLTDVGETAGFHPIPFAPAACDLRANIVGAVPRVRRLTYQLMGNYAFESSTPYTAGPRSFSASFNLPEPELVPAVRFTILFGLRYDLDSLR